MNVGDVLMWFWMLRTDQNLSALREGAALWKAPQRWKMLLLMDGNAEGRWPPRQVLCIITAKFRRWWYFVLIHQNS